MSVDRAFVELARQGESLERRLQRLESRQQRPGISRTLRSDVFLPSGFGVVVPGPLEMGVVTPTLVSGMDSLMDGLTSLWKQDEASGDALDSVPSGGNTLADNNTVGTAAGKLGTARQYVAASNEFHSLADNTDLSMGDIDFTWASWVYADSFPAGTYPPFLSKYGAAGAHEYHIGYHSANNRFYFTVSADGTVDVNVFADDLGVPATATWYLVWAWHDRIENTINIQVNNGAVNSVAHTGGVLDGATAFNLGGRSSVGLWNGRIDQTVLWKRILTMAERTAYYNNASGMAYPFTAVYTYSVESYMLELGEGAVLEVS